MAGRTRLLRTATLFVPVSLLAACATAPAPAPVGRVAPELRPFLPDPARLPGGGAEADRAAALHARLLRGEDPATLLSEAESIAAGASRGAALRLFVAEAALVAGDAARSLAEASALVEESAIPEAELVAGRAAESVGDPVAAVAHYRAAAAADPIAAERRDRLEPEAVSELRRRIEEALAQRRLETARAELRTLATWRAGERETWQLAARVAQAAGDRPGELDARRTVAAKGEEALEDRLRRGALEVEVGDAATGLALLEALAASRPDDSAARAEWMRARFSFRLANAPESVRFAAVSNQLTRSDFALLLYWLVPEVRSSRGGVPRIATDVLDHPAREEIVRVANLGLLRVDEELHLFEPERPLRRLEAFRALARVATGSLGEDARPAAAGEAVVCARAAEAGWIPEPAECLPYAAVSGAEALAWIRSAVEPAQEAE